MADLSNYVSEEGDIMKKKFKKKEEQKYEYERITIHIPGELASVITDWSSITNTTPDSVCKYILFRQISLYLGNPKVFWERYNEVDGRIYNRIRKRTKRKKENEKDEKNDEATRKKMESMHLRINPAMYSYIAEIAYTVDREYGALKIATVARRLIDMQMLEVLGKNAGFKIIDNESEESRKINEVNVSIKCNVWTKSLGRLSKKTSIPKEYLQIYLVAEFIMKNPFCYKLLKEVQNLEEDKES